MIGLPHENCDNGQYSGEDEASCWLLFTSSGNGFSATTFQTSETTTTTHANPNERKHNYKKYSKSHYYGYTQSVVHYLERVTVNK